MDKSDILYIHLQNKNMLGLSSNDGDLISLKLDVDCYNIYKNSTSNSCKSWIAAIESFISAAE